MKRVALLLSSCALISACINLEDAHGRCFESGRCGSDGGVITPDDAGISDAGHDAGTPDSGLDAGEVDAGIPDAGHDAGTPDSGVDDAGFDAGLPVPYDGGTPCGSTGNPRLRCAAPLRIATGSNINYGALVALPDRFLAGWTGDAFELRTIALDGGSTVVHSESGVVVGQVALAASGSHWVAAWMSNDAPSARCLTSNSMPSVVDVFPRDGGTLNVLNAAISPTGAVAVAGRRGFAHFVGGEDATGCPTEIPRLPFSTGTNGAAVTWTNGGFRFVNTGQFNAYNGGIEVADVADGGFNSHYQGSSLKAPSQSSVVTSSDGNTVITAYSAFSADDDEYDLMLYATSAELIGDGMPVTLNDTVDTGWWVASPCGANCVMTTMLGYSVGVPATVRFFADDPGIAPRGAWDAVCGPGPVAGNGTTISLAHLNGVIGVLMTRASTVDFYLCDMPPLP